VVFNLIFAYYEATFRIQHHRYSFFIIIFLLNPVTKDQ